MSEESVENLHDCSLPRNLSGYCRPNLASSSMAVVFWISRSSAAMFVLPRLQMVRTLRLRSASKRGSGGSGLVQALPAPRRPPPLKHDLPSSAWLYVETANVYATSHAYALRLF